MNDSGKHLYVQLRVPVEAVCEEPPGARQQGGPSYGVSTSDPKTGQAKTIKPTNPSIMCATVVFVNQVQEAWARVYPSPFPATIPLDPQTAGAIQGTSGDRLTFKWTESGGGTNPLPGAVYSNNASTYPLNKFVLWYKEVGVVLNVYEVVAYTFYGVQGNPATLCGA